MKFVLVKGPLETLNVMVDWIERELSKRDIEYFMLDIRQIDHLIIPNFIDFISSPDVAVLSFNNIGISLSDSNGNVWKNNNIPFYSWIGDHPRNYDDMLLSPPCDVYVFVLDENHKRFIERFYPLVNSTYIMHYGGRYLENLPSKYTDRDIDVVYMGTNGQPIDRFPVMDMFDDGGRDFFQTTVDMMISDPSYVTEDAIEEYFATRNISVSEEQLLDIFLNISGFIENYVRRETRFIGIKELDKAGVRVDIYGGKASWTSERYPFSDNIRIHERIDPNLVPDIMSRARITISYTPWFKLGCSEKPIDALLGGSLCVSDHNSYVDENYVDGKDIMLFDLADQKSMASRVKYMLDHPGDAAVIAKNGQVKSMDREQWCNRVEDIIELVKSNIEDDHSGDKTKSIDDERSSKKVSVIVACYNCSETINTAWLSVKNQSIGIENIECIFVDDASDDGGKTWEALQAIEKDSPESVMIIHLDENMRQGGARNVGISYASGKYLMFLDSDDELSSEACEKLFMHAEAHESDIIQFNHLYRLGEQSKIMESSKSESEYVIRHPKERTQFLNATTVSYGCTNKFYRMDLIRKVQARFAEHAVYEEPLFVYPCFLYADRISLITDAFYIYYLHPESTVTSAIGPRLLDHPRVQLELLEYCLNRPELFQTYKDEIGLYFLWSYYCETICFSVNNKTVIPIEYFKGMQGVCKRFFGDWRSNPMIRIVSDNVIGVLESIDREFTSQEELDLYIYEAAGVL